MVDIFRLAPPVKSKNTSIPPFSIVLSGQPFDKHAWGRKKFCRGPIRRRTTEEALRAAEESLIYGSGASQGAQPPFPKDQAHLGKGLCANPPLPP